MADAHLPQLDISTFRIEASAEDRTVRITFHGNADMRVSELLDAYFRSLHDEANRLGATEVAVDFRDLEFMNSSCFKSFVNWINLVRGAAPGESYRIRFLPNAGAHWQRRSLHALRCFAADLVSLQE